MYEGETVGSYDDLESIHDNSISIRSVKKKDLPVVPNGGDREETDKTLDAEENEACSEEE